MFYYIGYPFSAMLESMLNETVAQMGGGLLRDLFEASANLPVRFHFRRTNDTIACCFVLQINY